jgi:hypothetical protein
LYNWLYREGWFGVRSTREICGDAAGAESDGEDDNTCGIHTLLRSTFTPGCLNCMVVTAFPLSITRR